jgi:hypothetical protein
MAIQRLFGVKRTVAQVPRLLPIVALLLVGGAACLQPEANPSPPTQTTTQPSVAAETNAAKPRLLVVVDGSVDRATVQAALDALTALAPPDGPSAFVIQVSSDAGPLIPDQERLLAGLAMSTTIVDLRR